MRWVTWREISHTQWVASAVPPTTKEIGYVFRKGRSDFRAVAIPTNFQCNGNRKYRSLKAARQAFEQDYERRLIEDAEKRLGAHDDGFDWFRDKLPGT